ncbi:MAG: glycosyltransferase family 39 protein [Anaerolineae bacterium]|nr:glycosyltransferase family 39 protein [Anaerolineae bacterium]
MIHPIRRQHLFGLALILLAAGLLRFGNLDSSEFWYDEATMSTLAQSMADGESFPLLGIVSSAHIPNPPTGIYLLVVPYLISSDPMFAVVFIAALNVIGVGLLWLIAYRYFRPSVAMIAGLLYAVSPWAVVYSRKIWGQDMHTPLILAGFLLGLYGFVEKKRWAQALCLPVLVFAMQIHFAAWALLPAYVWLLWIERKRISWSAVVISIGLALLTLAPYIAGVIQTPGSPNAVRDTTGMSLIPLEQIVGLATGLGLGERFVFPPGVELISQYPVVGILWLALIPLTGLGLWRVWQRSRRCALFLLLWGFLTPVSLITGVYMSHPHYYIPCIPVYMLLAAEGIIWLAAQSTGKLRLRWATLAAVGAIAITQVADWHSFLTFADDNFIYAPGFMNNAYATPIRYYLDIRDHLDDDVVMIAGSIEQALPKLWPPLLHDSVTCLREAVIANGGIALLPDHPFSLLRAPGATPYEFADLYHSAEHLVFPLREGEGSYTLDRIDTPPTWNGPDITPIQPAPFDSGATLGGYRFANGRLYLDWSLAGHGTQDYQYFVHLLDVDGNRIAQHDASFYSGKYWCPGDRIITFIAFDRPPEAVTLRVGMYRLESGNIVGSNAYDQAGSAAPWVDLPLAGE